MRLILRLAMCACLAATTGLAWGQMVGDPAPEIRASDFDNTDDSVSLERFKNRIIVLIYWASTDAASVDLFPTFNELHEKYSKQGVVLIAVTREKKAKAESTVQGKEAKFIVGYEFNPEGDWNFSAPPYYYIIDIHGRIFAAREHAGDELEERIKEAIRKDPPPGADEQSLRNRFTRLSEYTAKKEWGRAYTLAKELEDIIDKDNKSMSDQVKEAVEQIEEGAEEWIREARSEVEAKNYKPACRKLAELSIRFTGSDVKEEADRELGRLQGDNLTKAIVRKAVDNAKGELKNDEAADREVAEQYLEARELYREVIEEYEDTDAAEAAKDAVDRINSDPKIQDQIKEFQARQESERWYDLGERFAKTQMYDLARAQFEKLIDKHPSSRAAQRARERLGPLAKEESRYQAELEKRKAEDAKKAEKGSDKQEKDEDKDDDG